MEKFCFFIRSITLAMGLTACSGLNQEVIKNDIDLLEEINEDFNQILKSKPIEPNNPDSVINSHFDDGKRSWQFVA